MSKQPSQPEQEETHTQGQLEDAAQPSPKDERVEELLTHTIDVPVLASAVEQQEAADAADTLEQLDEEEAADVLEEMDDQSAADALSEMAGPWAIHVLEDLATDAPEYASRLLQLMGPDDAADLLQAVGSEQGERLLGGMPAEAARRIRSLMGYPEESAGGLMTTDYLVVRTSHTVGDAIEVLRGGRLPEEVQSLPVIDESGTLVGIVTLRDLVLRQADEQVDAVMGTKVRVVRVGMDREEVARTFDRYDHAMLPVVDDTDHLLGIVTVDDVIDIIRAEQTEDVQLTVGAGAGEAIYSELPEKIRGRLPWLVTSLVMTMAAAAVIVLFEDLIARQRVLAFLLPVIAAVVGNAGHQALAVSQRGIVLDEVHRDRVAPLLVREAGVGVLNGVVLGVVLLLVVWWLADLRIGLVAGLAMTVSMSVGTVCGSGVPLLMRRFGIDPALASAIFMILITDAVSFACLLALVYWLLGA